VPAPESLPPRQESFCRFVAQGHSLAAAARFAGYAPGGSRQRGYELFQRPEIQRRAGALRAEIEDGRATEARDALAQLEEIRVQAMAAGRLGVALKAVSLRVRLLGIDRPARRRHTPEDPVEPADDWIRGDATMAMPDEEEADTLDPLNYLDPRLDSPYAVRPHPADPEPADPEPADPEPADLEPADLGPAGPDLADAGADRPDPARGPGTVTFRDAARAVARAPAAARPSPLDPRPPASLNSGHEPAAHGMDVPNYSPGPLRGAGKT
jgi:hypothetical protein